MRNKRFRIERVIGLAVVVGIAGCASKEGARQPTVAEPQTETSTKHQTPKVETEPGAASTAGLPNLLAAEQASRAGDTSATRRHLQAVPQANRGWLWHYLNASLDDSIRILDGHDGAVLAVATSGAKLVSTSASGSVRLWNASDASPSKLVTRSNSAVRAAALAPGGKQLAFATGAKTVLFDLAQNTQIAELSGHAEDVLAIAFSPDGAVLATAGADNCIRMWDITTLEPFAELTGHHAAIHCLAFDPAGTRLASGSNDHSVRLWNTDSLSQMGALEDLPGPVTALAFSADGSQLADATASGNITVYSAVTLQPEFTALSEQVNALAFSPDGSQLASTVGNRLQLWDINSGEAQHELLGHTGEIRALNWSPITGYLASGSDDGTVRLWDSAPADIFQDKRSTVRSLAFNSDGSRLAGASHDRTVSIWDMTTGAELAVLRGHTARNTGVDFSPDDKLIASASYDWDVMLWDAATGEQLALLRGHQNLVRCVCFSPDGKHLISAGHDGTVRIWDVAQRKEARVIQTGADVIITAAYSPNGKMIASGDHDTVRLWDAASGELLRKLGGHDRWVYSLAFSPSANQLASVDGDGFVRIWDCASGELLKTFDKYDKKLLNVTYSADGKLLFTSTQGDILVWEVASGRRLATLSGHQQWVCSQAFSPDNTLLVSGAEQGIVRLWDSVSHAQRYKERSKAAAAEPGAIALVSELWVADRSPGDIAAEIAADPALDPATRRAALNLVLSRSSARLETVQKYVDKLFREHVFSADVVAALQSHVPFDANLREVAIKRARARGDRPDRLATTAWLSVRRTERPADETALALRSAQAANQAQPDNPEFMRILGAAQYRNGLFEEALLSLTKAREQATQDDPYILAFLCMTYHQLAQTEQANATRVEFNEMIQKPRFSSDLRVDEAAKQVRQALNAPSD